MDRKRILIVLRMVCLTAMLVLSAERVQAAVHTDFLTVLWNEVPSVLPPPSFTPEEVLQYMADEFSIRLADYGLPVSPEEARQLAWYIWDLSSPTYEEYMAYSDSIFAGRIFGPLKEVASASSQTTNLVMSNLVLPVATTKKEKEDRDKAKAANRARLLDAQLRYEHVDFDSNTVANISGISLGIATDKDNFTYGAYLPYDYVRLKNSDFDMHRVGLILFGQYNLELSDNLQSTFTLNLPYTRMDFTGTGDVNVYGGGGGVNLTYDSGVIVPSVAVQYQYSKTDQDGDNYQHLIATGGNVGFRVGEMIVLNCFGIWNHDASSYLSDNNGDRDYFDVGGEIKYNVTETFSLDLGYKKVLGLHKVDSDMVYLGSIGNF